jgi:hypothetical protein
MTECAARNGVQVRTATLGPTVALCQPCCGNHPHRGACLDSVLTGERRKPAAANLSAKDVYVNSCVCDLTRRGKNGKLRRSVRFGGVRSAALGARSHICAALSTLAFTNNPRTRLSSIRVTGLRNRTPSRDQASQPAARDKTNS